jgi:hypothetical protein
VLAFEADSHRKSPGLEIMSGVQFPAARAAPSRTSSRDFVLWTFSAAGVRGIARAQPASENVHKSGQFPGGRMLL